MLRGTKLFAFVYFLAVFVGDSEVSASQAEGLEENEDPAITVEAMSSAINEAVQSAVDEMEETTDDLQKKIEVLEKQNSNLQDQLAELQILTHSREVCFEDLSNPKCEGSQSGQVGIVDAIRVDGGWTQWSDWSQCSETCGGGSQFKNRTCDNPEPKHGGKNCTGGAEDGRKCNQEECCSVNGTCKDPVPLSAAPTLDTAACSGSYEYGVEYRYNDIESCLRNKKPNPRACQEFCKTIPGCVGWEWGYDGDNCCAKSIMRNRHSVKFGRVAGLRDACPPDFESENDYGSTLDENDYGSTEYEY